MESKETYIAAFDEPPGTNLAGIPIKGLQLPSPYISYGRPYDESCAKHIQETFHASRVYIVASRSLSQNTDKLDKLIEAIGKDKVVGVRKGIIPHSPWSEILSIAAECRTAEADCIVTLGAGSLTDSAKLVVLVKPSHNPQMHPYPLTQRSVLQTPSPPSSSSRNTH
jgi:alcohol dehydrogenase class IV